MKNFTKLLLFAAISSLALSCAKDEEKLIMPTRIIVSAEEKLVFGKSGSEAISFEVIPADATFNYDVTSPDCHLKLERKANSATGSGSTFSPAGVTMSSVSPVAGKPGFYTAVITDKGNEIKYDESLLLRLTVMTKDGKWQTFRSNAFDVAYESWPVFKDFAFLKEHNPKAINQDYKINLASGDIKLESPLIGSPLLVASFDSKGAKLYVDGVEQISGVTANDFSKPVTYTVKSKNEFKFTVSITHSGLPMVFIQTAGGKEIPSKYEDWLSGSDITIYNPDWTVDYSGTMGIRGRGNSTWSYPKKPYALKLDSKAEILGMPKHKRWVLLANWMDRTILRNCVSFKLAEMSGLAYTPRGQFVEVFLNGEHKGNYFLCEHIKVDKNRVNIDELDDDETDGGYIMELDSYYDEINKFKSSVRNLPYMFKDPDEVNSQQFKFIQDYVNNFERSLYDDARFATGEYRNYIDAESFADWWIVMELTGIWEPNHPKSTYMHKDKGGKLTMGPVWDFDWETYMPVYMNGYRISEALYYKRLFQDPYFTALIKERWNAMKDDFSTLPEFIRSEAERIGNSEYMNNKMWPITSYVNRDEKMSFEEAVEAMIKGYEGKFTWLDAKIRSL